MVQLDADATFARWSKTAAKSAHQTKHDEPAVLDDVNVLDAHRRALGFGQQRRTQLQAAREDVLGRLRPRLLVPAESVE